MDGVRVAVVVALGGQVPDPQVVALVGRVGQKAGGGAWSGLVATDLAQRHAAVGGRGGDVVRNVEVVGGPLGLEVGHLAGKVGEEIVHDACPGRRSRIRSAQIEVVGRDGEDISVSRICVLV